MMMRTLMLTAWLLTGALAAPVEAATFHRLFGDSNGDFTLPARPTPDSYSETYFGIAGQPGRLNGNAGTYSFYFYTAPAGGGFDMANDDGSDDLIQLAGPVLFTGPVTAPRFIAGRFNLIDLEGNGGYTLTITGVPEPASWAMLIAGFGLVGAAMRRQPIVAA